jgi:hypothetical protein
MALKEKDFEYYKKEIDDDIKFHRTKMSEVNRPSEVKAAYKGKFETDGLPNTDSDYMTENHLFISANTVLPSLFFQLPRLNVRPKFRDDLRFAANIINGLGNVYLNEDVKKENQLAIIDTFLPYGYGAIKSGYNSRVGTIKQPKTSKFKELFTGKVEGENSQNDNAMESEVEYIKYERPVLLRHSPKHTYLDRRQDFNKGTRMTLEYQRSVQNLIDSNLYKLDKTFIDHFKSRSGTNDLRCAYVTLYESWMKMDKKIFKLVYVEDWPEELAFIETDYDEIPVSLLRFNKMGDVLYNVAHGTLGLEAQKELNFLNELWKKHVENIRNQFIIDDSGLTNEGKITLNDNPIGGIIKATRPGLTAIPLMSQGVDPALFSNIENLRQYLSLLMSTSGGKGGGESELATVEKNKALGDALRSSGMQDDIRDFYIDQAKKMVKNILKFGDPELTVTITGDNVINPLTGETLNQGDAVKIGGETGIPLRQLIEGDIDIDYVFDVDITSAARPDFPVIRKQLAEGITIATQLAPLLQGSNKKVNYDLMLEDYFSTFDAIPNAKKYVSDLSGEEKQRLLSQIAPSGMEGAGTGTGIPGETTINAGAETVPTGVEGLNQV